MSFSLKEYHSSIVSGAADSAIQTSRYTADDDNIAPDSIPDGASARSSQRRMIREPPVNVDERVGRPEGQEVTVGSIGLSRALEAFKSQERRVGKEGVDAGIGGE